MHPNVTQAIRVFLQRVDLKGGEVPAFYQILLALDEEDKKTAAPPAPPTLVVDNTQPQAPAAT